MSFALIASASVPASDKRIALVIPQTTSKAQIIYDEMLAGINSAATVEVTRFNLNSTTTADELSSWLKEQQPSAVIAIGKSAHALASSAGLDVPLVVGSMGSTPEGASGVALAGEPIEFFVQVRRLAPRVQRVHLVYNERINGWWIDTARQAAEMYGINLIAREAASVRAGAKHYKKILKEAQADVDAIWIPLVSIVPSKTVLPMVLRKAWEKHLIVFTNNPLHAKQGALFSLYPDNATMGTQLMQLALEQSEPDSGGPKIILSSNMKRAFNWRTASHLGLDYTLEKEAGFDRIYPVQ